MRPLVNGILVLVIASPFALFAIAQTSRLHDAVTTGGLVEVKRALKPWKSVDGINRSGYSPLGLSIQLRKPDVAHFLLERGASVQLTTGRGTKLDHFVEAARWKRPEFVALFLERGLGTDLGAALEVAAENGDLDTVRLLLDHKAPTHEALYAAVARASQDPVRLQIVKVLLERGGIPRASSEDGRLLAASTLYALPKFDARLLQLLLENGLPVNARDRSKHTLLYIASRLKNLEAARMLLAHGADANDGGMECASGPCQGHFRTALHEAVNLTPTRPKDASETGRELADLLISRGARVDVWDPQGATPLMVALHSRNLAGVEALIQAGADPRLGYRGRTPIDRAQKLQDSRFSEALAKADLERIDRNRKTRVRIRAPEPSQKYEIAPYGSTPRAR